MTPTDAAREALPGRLRLHAVDVRKDHWLFVADELETAADEIERLRDAEAKLAALREALTPVPTNTVEGGTFQWGYRAGWNTACDAARAALADATLAIEAEARAAALDEALSGGLDAERLARAMVKHFDTFEPKTMRWLSSLEAARLVAAEYERLAEAAIRGPRRGDAA